MNSDGCRGDTVPPSEEEEEEGEDEVTMKASIFVPALLCSSSLVEDKPEFPDFY